MKNLKNEIMNEQLNRMKRNLIPSLIAAIIAMLLCFVCLVYVFKAKLGLSSLVGAMQMLCTSVMPMLGILIIGCIIFIICWVLEDN